MARAVLAFLWLLVGPFVPAASPGLLLRNYGVAGDGRTDDTQALQRAMDDAQGRWLLGDPGATYVVRGTLHPRNSLRLDLRGGCLQLTGAVPYLFRTDLPVRVVHPLRSVPMLGARLLRLASPCPDLAPGRWFRLGSTALGGRVPPSFRRILELEGETVRLDRPLAFPYPEGTTLSPVAWEGTFHLKNGALTRVGEEAIIQLLWIGGFDRVSLEHLSVAGFKGGECNLFLIQDCRSVTIRECLFQQNALQVSGEAINVWDAAIVRIEGNHVDGEGFGIAATRCDAPIITRNRLRGRAASGRATSVRGIKVVGCAAALILNNRIKDYTSAIKSEDSGTTAILRNRCENSAPGSPTSYAIAASNPHPDPLRHGGHIISGNRIRTSGGIGIFLDAGSPNCRVEGNAIQDTASFAIYAAGAGNRISRNTIQGFGKLLQTPAIMASRTSTIGRNPSSGGPVGLPAIGLLEPSAPPK